MDGQQTASQQQQQPQQQQAAGTAASQSAAAAATSASPTTTSSTTPTMQNTWGVSSSDSDVIGCYVLAGCAAIFSLALVIGWVRLQLSLRGGAR